MVDLQDVLVAVPELQDARVAQQLTDGPVADKWQLCAAGRFYSVRIDRPAASVIGLNRYEELTALEALAGAGWCDAPVRADPADGILVLPWAEGLAWTNDEFQSHQCLQQLAGLLYALHSSGLELPDFRLQERNQVYATVAGSQEIRRQAADVRAMLAEVGEGPGAGCPCHNDPVAGNVLGLPEPGFIDFEYAAAGNSYFDLAAVFEHHGLDPAAREALLGAYAAAGGAVDRELLDIWRRIYNLTAANWAAALISATR